MGVGTHTDFQNFQLLTRITQSVFGAGSQGETAIDGDYYGSSQYGALLISYSWQYSQNIGMVYNGINNTDAINFTLYFSDEDNNALYAYKNTTTDTSEDLAISSTTTYEATTEYVFLPDETISTSWSDKTTSNITRNRSYTTISSTANEPYGLGDGGAFEANIICQKTNGLALVFEPHIGSDWSVEGSALSYYQLFTATGEYSNTYSNIFFDKDLSTTISAITTTGAANSSFQAGSTVNLTYAYTSNAQTTITIINSQVETNINGQLYLTSSVNQETSFYKIVTESSSLSYVIAEEFTETAETGDISALFSQRITSVKSTAVHYIIDNFYTYNSTFTYSGLIDTTRMYSYLLFSQSCGSHSSTSAYETTSGPESAPVPTTSTQSFTTIKPVLTNTYFVSHYSILLGTSKSEWNKSYIQKCVVNPFAIAFTSEDANRYASSINGASNVIFTSYKFDVLSDFSLNPKLYVPINATEYSYNTDNTSYYTQTIQAVSIPSAFYYGLSSATVSRTTLTSNSITTTSVTGTQAVAYAGAQSTVLGGHISKNDFENAYWTPPFNSKKIMHTIGVLGKSSASYNMNGYFVYNSALARTVVGDSVNPISIIGNGQVTTVIASAITAQSCFPCVSNVIGYANSYG